jgi:F-type H+-transporting ATPase subunit a
VDHWLLAAEGNGFVAPGPGIFELPPIFEVAGFGFTKPMAIILLSVPVIFGFFYAAARSADMVPGKLQFAAESAYGFVRNGIGFESIGKDALRFVPFLATLFFFISFNNFAGIIPGLQLPATGRIAYPLVLAALVWGVYNYLGMKRAGPIGYFKEMMFPPGIPWPVYIVLAPIELLSNVIVRPVTLCLRLTLNMFAGHLVLVLFILGGEYLLLDYGGWVGILSGSVTLIGSIIFTFFKAFIMLLQAYVFTLLTALFIGGALVEEH